jgi:hypothetical protein
MNPKSLTKNNIQNSLSLGILNLGLKEEETRRGKALSSSSNNSKRARRILVFQKPETDTARKLRIQNIPLLTSSPALKPQRRHAVRLRYVQLMQQPRSRRINLPNHVQEQVPGYVTRKKGQNHARLGIQLQISLYGQTPPTQHTGIRSYNHKKPTLHRHTRRACLNPNTWA